jgi:hypothetical protein
MLQFIEIIVRSSLPKLIKQLFVVFFSPFIDSSPGI